MRHDLDALTVSPETDALQALSQIQRAQAPRLLVTENGRLVGIVTLKDLMHFLNVKLELGADDGHRPAAPPFGQPYPGRAPTGPGPGRVTDRQSSPHGQV